MCVKVQRYLQKDVNVIELSDKDGFLGSVGKKEKEVTKNEIEGKEVDTEKREEKAKECNKEIVEYENVTVTLINFDKDWDEKRIEIKFKVKKLA